MNTAAPPQPLRTGVLILAAGAGSRMGGRAKCLLQIEGRSLLERLVQSVRSAGLSTPALDLVLVLGHHAAEIQAHVAQWPEHCRIRPVLNPAPGDDPASSLHAGLLALDADVQAVVVLLADQPLIGAEDIAAVMHAFHGRPAGCQLVLPMVGSVPGHPVVFDAAVRADLMAAPRSLKQWRAAHPQATLLWAVDNTHHTRDLDTPADLDSLASETGWDLRWPDEPPGSSPGVNTDPAAS